MRLSKMVLMSMASMSLAGCSLWSSGTPEDPVRVVASNGSTVKCNHLELHVCGAVLTGCENKHEYRCVHTLDTLAKDAPDPVPPQPAPAPAPQPAPQPTPQKAPAAPTK